MSNDTLKTKIAEKLGISEQQKVPYLKGDNVRLLVRTREPNYGVGTILTVVEPYFDSIGREPLVLTSGPNGDLAVTMDMVEPA